MATSLPQLAQILRDEGLSGALAAINHAVPHRYTGVFFKAGPLLENIALHDKKVARAKPWAPFALGQSFCSIILASGDPLTVREASQDARTDVNQHPAGAIVQCYCGVPLLSHDGTILGTLCHFDEEPMSAAIDLVSMLRIPRLLRAYLPPAPG